MTGVGGPAGACTRCWASRGEGQDTRSIRQMPPALLRHRSDDVHVNRNMGQGSLLDYGMFLGNVMVAAGGAWIPARRARLEQLRQASSKPLIRAGPDRMLVCGMAWVMRTGKSPRW